ncbi:GTP 3',8-cyclase MoaA [Amphritea sp. HPY]|uniref:GTP 3',8-cyclase MoaA n=1 Tax=Amphritea sp. HPY TaxID=3421652 RepID=UPI003D7E83CF
MNQLVKPLLQDSFGRSINYLRLSVTDRCDFRCVYCMNEDVKFLPRAQVLTLEELYSVAQTFTELGVNKIRLTGGEPLVRPGIVDLCREVGQLPGLRELTLTTNGSQLERYAEGLRQAGVKRINISLDSLDQQRFTDLTRRDKLAQVISGIDAAVAAGFERIKLNAVVMKGRNDDEVLDLVEFARSRGIDITFIEEMPLGDIQEHSRQQSFCSSDEVQTIIAERFPLLSSTESSGGPARYFRMAGSKSRVGFISPYSHNFCDSCNRVRVTVEGQLLLCLGNEKSLDLRRLLRGHPGDLTAVKQAICDALQHKPEAHDFSHGDDVQVVRFMNMTGG